jgi:hypothetical protein
MRDSIVLAGFFAHAVAAIKPPLAEPTNALLNVDLKGVTPKPTGFPMPHLGLKRRAPAAASSGSLLAYVCQEAPIVERCC